MLLYCAGPRCSTRQMYFPADTSPQQKERHMMLDTNTAFLTILLLTMHNLSNATLESQVSTDKKTDHSVRLMVYTVDKPIKADLLWEKKNTLACLIKHSNKKTCNDTVYWQWRFSASSRFWQWMDETKHNINRFPTTETLGLIPDVPGRSWPALVGTQPILHSWQGRRSPGSASFHAPIAVASILPEALPRRMRQRQRLAHYCDKWNKVYSQVTTRRQYG